MFSPLIFITGSTGFIGAHTVLQSLEAGYRVRLSVRKESQISSLRTVFADHIANVDFVVIPNLSADGAHDGALKDVTYIFHIASPMPGTGDDFKTEYLAPAVDSTTALLDAANKTPSIKRVVIVSSVVALVPLEELATGNFHAKEGNNPSIAIDPDMPFPSDPEQNAMAKYSASKIFAHRATLEWVASVKPSFTVVTLHPVFVFGQNLLQTKANSLEGTNGMLWGALHSESPFFNLMAVDVRDVAAAHVKALSVDAEKGKVEEFLLHAGEAEGWTWEKVGEFAKGRYPAFGFKVQGAGPVTPTVDTTRAREKLGVKFRTMADTLSSFLDHQVKLRASL
ncbi:NAD dependent epimerase/dehydratase [Elsinoe ampelina]|uniref:NAD dependent epimerase/dehydratase n=1 Tax=Elsinoe ampelina TaxID=302913 RepID=A0A6A6GHK2_9PEZI|nr:NAD dependent epimerase/dehydratase [Elsinoe ampelina]